MEHLHSDPSWQAVNRWSRIESDLYFHSYIGSALLTVGLNAALNFFCHLFYCKASTFGFWLGTSVKFRIETLLICLTMQSNLKAAEILKMLAIPELQLKGICCWLEILKRCGFSKCTGFFLLSSPRLIFVGYFVVVTFWNLT